jgi:hypothetical protein
MRVKFHRSLPLLLARVSCAAAAHVTAEAQTPGQNINPLALHTRDQQYRRRPGATIEKLVHPTVGGYYENKSCVTSRSMRHACSRRSL